VLDLSRLESCRVYHLDAVDLPQAVEQTLRTYQLNAKDKGIELEQQVDPYLPPALGHYDLLLQVFANLVGNALKFTQSGGKVAIRAYLLESEAATHQDGQSGKHNLSPNTGHFPVVRVEISDTGIGIDPEDQQAIFDRFFRVENRVHTLEGTGLGLSIVRNIIDKHHTKINLVSEVNVGTTFWFDLAVYQPKQTLEMENSWPVEATVESETSSSHVISIPVAPE
jgi:two-component system sensor histidine kinase NblS